MQQELIKQKHYFINLANFISESKNEKQKNPNLIYLQKQNKYINIIVQQMSIYQKYKILRSLGKAQFDKVFLAQYQNKKYAIKQLSKELVKANQLYSQYLQQQFDCMNNIHSPYIIKILKEQEDDINYYFICQYCDGGNLINYQQKLQNQVFPVELALKAISHVITGLLEMHQHQYLYKDIKPQNIMVDKNDKDEEIFKLADFGFDRNFGSKLKKSNDSINFMAPERFQELIKDGYQIGFGVDIWSMGVTLYYMINGDYPFQLTQDSKQNIQIIKKTCTPYFNYKKNVLKSKKNLTRNDDQSLIDLFQQIFRFNSDERISFHDMKTHTLLQEYFTNQIIQRSCIVYNKNFESKIKSRFGKDKFQKGKNQKKMSIIQQQIVIESGIKNTTEKLPPKNQDPHNQTPNDLNNQTPNHLNNQTPNQPNQSENKKNDSKYTSVNPQNKIQFSIVREQLNNQIPHPIININIPQEKSIENQRKYSVISSQIISEKFEKELAEFCYEKQRNQFLLSISEFFLEDIKNFSIQLKFALRYYTLKLYIIYTRNLKQKYQQKIIPPGTANKLNWEEFFNSSEYKILVKQINEQLNQQEKKFVKIHHECSIRLELIQSQISNFRQGLSPNITETDLEGDFKLAYRQGTSYSYGIINQKLKNKKLSKQQSVRLYFAMINIFICHCINRMFDKSNIPSTFYYYYKWKKINYPEKPQFDFTSFKKWLTVQNRDNLQQTTVTIIKKYFDENLAL